ncbi:MAG: hypothetical protein R2856_26255 [Caldilineaceae bacterium]
MILPDVIPTDAALVEKLTDFPARCGGLIASFESGMDAEKSGFVLDAHWASPWQRTASATPKDDSFASQLRKRRRLRLPARATSCARAVAHRLRHVHAGDAGQRSAGDNDPGRDRVVLFRPHVGTLLLAPADAVLGRGERAG